MNLLAVEALAEEDAGVLGSLGGFLTGRHVQSRF